MTYRIGCQCGKGVFAELADAGGKLVCGCGRAVVVPMRTQLLRMPPSARRASAQPPRRSETEAARTLASAKWWFLAGVVILVVGWWLAASADKSPGPCVELIGVGLMIVGGLRLVRGLVQRKADSGEPAG